jgi:hypothetical protein
MWTGVLMEPRPCKDRRHRFTERWDGVIVCRDCPIQLTPLDLHNAYHTDRSSVVQKVERDWYIKELES